MTLHEPFPAAGDGGARHGRRTGAGRGFSAAPGRMARAPARLRGRRELAAIERRLAADAPGLSARLALFNRLTRGEAPVGREQIPRSFWPRPGRAHLAVLVALAAIVALCLLPGIQGRQAVRRCQPAAAAGTVHAPGRGPGCKAYAKTRQ